MLPEAFLTRIQFQLGEEYEEFLRSLERPRAVALRFNPLKGEVPQLPFVGQPVPWEPMGYYYDPDSRPGLHLYHEAGVYYLQEASAMAPVAMLDVRPGDRVCDLCAAPGGKSTQIAGYLQERGMLLCNEIHPARAKILARNVERLGIANALVTNEKPENLAKKLPGFFDRVLVDAPCSGEGMFRKEEAAVTDWSQETVEMCARRQREILESAAVLLRAGGRLVYSTCTFAPEENELAVARFLNRHPEFAVEPITVDWGCPGFPAAALTAFGDAACSADLTGCRRIFPHQGGEGHFIARLRKTEDAPGGSPAPYAVPARDAHRETARALYEDCFADTPVGTFVTVGDAVRLLPPELPELKGTGTLAAGLAVAQIAKNRLEPCHAAFAAATGADCRRLLSLAPSDPQLAAFLHGEEIPAAAGGYTAVAVAGIPLGFGKGSGGRLKNRYPKGLRTL